ncbi:MAG: PEGA domain-containing protein [Verrucomicrobiota bacterium]
MPAAISDGIAEELRQRVAASHDLTLVSGKDLVEVKLVFSCADESATCMAQAGKSLDAQKMIYGSIKRVGDEYAIWLKMFDVRKAKIDFWLTESIAKKQTDPASIKAASSRWFAKLTGRPLSAGTVQVTSNPFGARVSLDGNAVGVSQEQPLTIPDVSAGRHELVAEKAGYGTAKQQFLIAAGQVVPINLTLGPAGGVKGSDAQASAVRPAADRENPRTTRGMGSVPSRDGSGYRTGFWVTLAAGLASAGAAVKFGLDVKDVNSKLDPYRRFPCTGANAGQLCDTKGAVRQPLTTDENNKKGRLDDEGRRAETLQWICVGVGSALGVASGYLFYKGYIDSDEDQGRREAYRGLRIFPTAGASSGGILAEFDF